MCAFVDLNANRRDLSRYLWRNRFHQVTQLEEGGCADCCEGLQQAGETHRRLQLADWRLTFVFVWFFFTFTEIWGRKLNCITVMLMVEERKRMSLSVPALPLTTAPTALHAAHRVIYISWSPLTRIPASPSSDQESKRTQSSCDRPAFLRCRAVVPFTITDTNNLCWSSEQSSLTCWVQANWKSFSVYTACDRIFI